LQLNKLGQVGIVERVGLAEVAIGPGVASRRKSSALMSLRVCFALLRLAALCVIGAKYSPNDGAAINLDLWHHFRNARTSRTSPATVTGRWGA
jgi:hypothetical protein